LNHFEDNRQKWGLLHSREGAKEGKSSILLDKRKRLGGEEDSDFSKPSDIRMGVGAP